MAKSPTVWRVAHGRLLVGYTLPEPADWPAPRGTPAAWQVLGRHGRVLGQWAQRADHAFVAAGRYFVGLQPSYTQREPFGDASGAILVRHGTPAPLHVVPGQRRIRRAELRLDGGWLVDPGRLTITREDLPRCRRASSRLDAHGRIWCLSRHKDEVLWSDDGRVWRQHRLSTSYFTYCDGGTLGSNLEILGDVVTIGLLRADFSVDRGETWETVSLPVERVGAGAVPPAFEQNCAQVSPLPDHRLVVRYFGALIADDASNTRFRDVATPGTTRFAGVQEGVMLAASRKPYGQLLASDDSGRTWRPLEARHLAERLLARQE